MRIKIIGTSGSGKTTLARQAAQRLGLPYIELDALYWGPDWTERPTDEFAAAIRRAVGADGWVMCGNYETMRHLIMPRVQVLVWLDYPHWLVMSRVLRRSVRRSLTRETLWAGNHESFRKSLFSRDSIILWAWTSHIRRQRQYAKLFSGQDRSHVQLVRLRTPREAEVWLRSLPDKAPLSRPTD
jgi:adenylate kinase family enzyme